MTIDVVEVADVKNPQELRDWYTDHPLAVISRIMNVSGIFYIFYE